MILDLLCRRHQVFTPTNELCKKENDIGQELIKFTEIDRSYDYIISESGLNSQKDIREHFSKNEVLTVLATEKGKI
jgi:hypothetical protein